MDFSGVIRNLQALRATLPCTIEYEPHLASPGSYEAKYESTKNAIFLNGYVIARANDPEKKKEFLIYHELFHALCHQEKELLQNFASLGKTEEELADDVAGIIVNYYIHSHPLGEET